MDWYDGCPSWAAGPEGKDKRNACGWNPAPLLEAGECRQHSPASFRAHIGARMTHDRRGAPVQGYDTRVTEEGDYYSVDQAAKILKRTPGRIRQMLRAGELEGVPPKRARGAGIFHPRTLSTIGTGPHV
jgi:hypothetical protein